MNQQVIIFDTTLRDGEQALQKSLNVNKKLKIALSLEKMGVDIIEVGFPISSPGDFKSVQIIASEIKNIRICSLARCVKKDIDLAINAMSKATDPRIHIFLGTSDLHIQSKLKKNFEDIVQMAVYFIKYAIKYSHDVEFSCEDAGRTSVDNLCRIVYEAIKAGANTINIPDTVGYTIPNQFSKIIQTLYDRVPNIHKAIISVHCHNDLGMAVANSISAIEAGARQVEGTINGIGERAGNTALEELIMAIKVKKELLGLYTNINHREIYKTSQTISQLCNIPIAPNKAIVGSNAFAHSSGIHQDGILKNRKNYEIIEPKTIGFQNIQFNLTSRSGRAAVKHHMKQMGYSEVVDYDINKLYKKFLELADKKGQVFDYELVALAFFENLEKKIEYFKLKSFDFQLKSTGISTINIELLCGTKLRNETTCTNKGILHAIFKLLSKITEYTFILEKLQSTTKNNDISALKLNQTDIEVNYKNQKFKGSYVDYDITKSSLCATINILNDIWQWNQIQSQLKNLNKN